MRTIIRFVSFAVLCIVLAIISPGCKGWLYSNVYRYEDEFSKSTKTTGRVNVISREPVTDIGSADIIFENEESSTGKSNASAYFVIQRASSSFGIKKPAFVKIGDKTFEVKITETFPEFKSGIESSAFSSMSSDSSGIKASSLVNTSTRNWIDEKFQISLAPEMISSLGSAGEVIIRFYFGPETATYRLRGRDLKTMKRVFLSH